MRIMRERSPFSRAMLQIAPLTAFTVIAVLGYFFFVVPPHGPANLAWIASLDGFDWIPGFYASSFVFFAQAHIVVGLVVLAAFLLKRSGLSWLGSFGVVYGISLASELLGTTTGLPFGQYSYTGLLGPRLFDHVPYLIPVSWFLMSIPAYLIATDRFEGTVPRILFGAALLTAWDLALDPAMSFITSYWTWVEPGSYYGMPMINLLGWFATSVVLMMALNATAMKEMASARTSVWMWVYYLVTVLLPVGMITAAGLWPASLLTLGTVALLFALWKRNGKRQSARSTSTLSARDLNASTNGPVESPAQLAALTALPLDLHDYFEHHSRSFSFAARFFSPEDRERVCRLYAFCRITDDLVDEHTVGDGIPDVREVLDSWKSIARSSFDGATTGVVWLDTLMAETRESGAGFAIVKSLFDGVESDLDRVRLQTEKELDAYAYRVGSVVGIWMCYLLGVKSSTMHAYAADLGSAMQITNILRDVGEDLESDRVYLPASLLHRFGVTEAELWEMKKSRRVSARYVSLLRYLMTVADDRYENAWAGLVTLPEGFGLAGAVASGVYRGIHREIIVNGYDNLTSRARTSRFRKSLLAFRSWIQLRTAVRDLDYPHRTPTRKTQELTLSRSEQSFADEYHA